MASVSLQPPLEESGVSFIKFGQDAVSGRVVIDGQEHSIGAYRYEKSFFQKGLANLLGGGLHEIKMTDRITGEVALVYLANMFYEEMQSKLSSILGLRAHKIALITDRIESLNCSHFSTIEKMRFKMALIGIVNNNHKIREVLWHNLDICNILEDLKPTDVVLDEGQQDQIESRVAKVVEQLFTDALSVKESSDVL